MPSFDDLGTDELVAHIFGFLEPEDIVPARLNNKMREAAKKTIVPLTNFIVNSVVKYNAMAAMTRALPNLQQITLRNGLGQGHKYSDGKDADEDWGSITANCIITQDIKIISNFSKLHDLNIHYTPLNGRYTFLFNFPLLQKLSLRECHYLKWDLEMLACLPLLTELYCVSNNYLTGNINSLRVLKDTLTKLEIANCHCVEGNFMDLANFPHLNYMDLRQTAVTGDIQEIVEQDFPALEYLKLPNGVYGRTDYEFQCISDVSEFVNKLYSIKKHRPNLLKDWYGTLSVDSPDWYNVLDDFKEPPFYTCFVQAGLCVGYRWETCVGIACEVNWLDPEPAKESREYETYIEELKGIERQVDIYRGFHQPPTEEEYNRMWEELRDD